MGQFILFDQITVSRFVPIEIIWDLTLLSYAGLAVVFIIVTTQRPDVQRSLYAGWDRQVIRSAPWLES